MHISVVSPVYKAPTILPELVDRLRIALIEITDSFEIILVDDGCPLNSWSIIEELAIKFNYVKGIKLTRNFGQHHAIKAGIDHCTGDWTIVIDCDLQDDPSAISELYAHTIRSESDGSFAIRINRKDNFIKKIQSRFFNTLFSFLTDLELIAGTGNFGIFNRQLIDSFKSLNEANRTFRPAIIWLGYKISYIPVEHKSRFGGKSSYSLRKLFDLAFSMMSGFSNRPLTLSIYFGFTMSICSIAFAIFAIINKITNVITLPGYSSIIFSIWFVGSIIITLIGMLGLYISRIHANSNQRPIYIIQKKI